MILRGGNICHNSAYLGIWLLGWTQVTLKGLLEPEPGPFPQGTSVDVQMCK